MTYKKSILLLCNILLIHSRSEALSSKKPPDEVGTIQTTKSQSLFDINLAWQCAKQKWQKSKQCKKSLEDYYLLQIRKANLIPPTIINSWQDFKKDAELNKIEEDFSDFLIDEIFLTQNLSLRGSTPRSFYIRGKNERYIGKIPGQILIDANNRNALTRSEVIAMKLYRLFAKGLFATPIIRVSKAMPIQDIYTSQSPIINFFRIVLNISHSERVMSRLITGYIPLEKLNVPDLQNEQDLSFSDFVERYNRPPEYIRDPSSSNKQIELEGLMATLAAGTSLEDIDVWSPSYQNCGIILINDKKIAGQKALVVKIDSGESFTRSDNLSPLEAKQLRTSSTGKKVLWESLTESQKKEFLLVKQHIFILRHSFLPEILKKYQPFIRLGKANPHMDFLELNTSVEEFQASIQIHNQSFEKLLKHIDEEEKIYQPLIDELNKRQQAL